MSSQMLQLRINIEGHSPKNEHIQGARPREAEIMDAPSKFEDPMEIERHEVTHIPPMPWCFACRLGKGRDASHFRSPAVREAAQIQVNFCFFREDAAAYDVATDPVPNLPSRQSWTGSWRRSRRQVGRLEFDQRKRLARYSSQSFGAVGSMQSLVQRQ